MEPWLCLRLPYSFLGGQLSPLLFLFLHWTFLETATILLELRGHEILPKKFLQAWSFRDRVNDDRSAVSNWDCFLSFSQINPTLVTRQVKPTAPGLLLLRLGMVARIGRVSFFFSFFFCLDVMINCNSKSRDVLNYQLYFGVLPAAA